MALLLADEDYRNTFETFTPDPLHPTRQPAPFDNIMADVWNAYRTYYDKGSPGAQTAFEAGFAGAGTVLSTIVYGLYGGSHCPNPPTLLLPLLP